MSDFDRVSDALDHLQGDEHGLTDATVLGVLATSDDDSIIGTLNATHADEHENAVNIVRAEEA